jgi:hypothetical protein
LAGFKSRTKSPARMVRGPTLKARLAIWSRTPILSAAVAPAVGPLNVFVTGSDQRFSAFGVRREFSRRYAKPSLTSSTGGTGRASSWMIESSDPR